MAVGDQGTHVPSTAAAAGCGPMPHDISKHVKGSGERPGTGSVSAVPTPQHPGNKGH